MTAGLMPSQYAAVLDLPDDMNLSDEEAHITVTAHVTVSTSTAIPKRGCDKGVRDEQCQVGDDSGLAWDEQCCSPMETVQVSV